MSSEIANGERQMANLIDDSPIDFPKLPTETEIYILPDGKIVVADLPVELARMIADLQVLRHTDSDVGL